MPMPPVKPVADDGTHIVNALLVHPRYADFLPACANNGGVTFNPRRVLNKAQPARLLVHGERASEAS